MELTPHDLTYQIVINYTLKYNKRFNMLGSIKTSDDKLGIDEDNNLYIENESIFQGIKRWYFNQSRDRLFHYFQEHIGEYIHFVSKLIKYIQTRDPEQKYYDMLYLNCKCINNIMTGLEFVLEHYKDERRLQATLAAIIDKLIDIKSNCDEILKERKKNITNNPVQK